MSALNINNSTIFFKNLFFLETFFTWHMICSLEVICKLVSKGKIHWFPICRFSWNMKLSTAHHPVTNQLLKNGRFQVSFNRLDFTWLTFVFLEPWWVTSVKDICWWLQYYLLRWRLKILLLQYNDSSTSWCSISHPCCAHQLVDQASSVSGKFCEIFKTFLVSSFAFGPNPNICPLW